MAEGAEYELEPLRREGDFTFYRGKKRSDELPILAVAAAAEQPSPQSLRRLEHEFALAKELDARWAVQPLTLTRHEGRATLILDDPGGEPLDGIIERQNGKPIELTRFLHVALGLTEALGQTHRQGVIHRDVRPANALVDNSGQARLTGFGMASRLPRERLAPAAPEVLAGTLAYMSPEQTGRMNRSIDTRSDLYSLGVTLYQLLTGSLPFAAADPLEWVHCHIARQPAAPIERRPVPVPLSTIIMRLLAKNAEDRYQTATGLEADLQRCLTEWQLLGRIDPFPLGADDSSDRLLISEKLYGREREVDALLTAFDRVVANGTAELVLVSGYSGVGKSSVVNELHKVLVSPRGLFASGKFDQYKRDIPYATLAQAFQMLVRQILVKSQAEVDRWRSALLDALGPHGQLMVSLVPEVEFVIGKQPPVAELPPQEARHRFRSVLQRFLGAFATAEHPLALFLDDLHWLDAATLEWLESLMSDPDVRHVLLIGAYRDNEVGPGHPLTRTLTAVREAGRKTEEIVLAPLGRQDLERLVADALHCGREPAGLLAQLLHERTGGNPFFATQFLTALAEEGLLRFDRAAAAWIWDLGRIRAKGYSDNPVDLVMGKLRRLSGSTQEALQTLACLGNVAEIATLAMASGQPDERIHTSLLEAVKTGLILRLDGSYAFLHDRIQEAAYALISEGHRAQTHLRIGRTLLANLTEEGLNAHLFDVANQLNRGSELLLDHEDKVLVAGIDLRAGRRAKASAAYASAREYLCAGMALLDGLDWTRQYALTFAFHFERAECELFAGDFDTAGTLIEQMLQRAASKVDEAAAACLKVQLHVIKSELGDAVSTALTSLRSFGIDLPAHATAQRVRTEYEAVLQALEHRPIEGLLDLPLITGTELPTAMKLLSALYAPAYLTDFPLACLQTCLLVRMTLQYGPSSDSVHALATWGSGPGWAFHRHDEAYRFAKVACDLVEKHGFHAIRPRVYASAAQSMTWTQPVTTAIERNQRAIRAAIEMGDRVFACFPMVASIPLLLLRGDSLDALQREADRALEFARAVHFVDIADRIVGMQRFVAMMQGRTAGFSTFNDDQFDEVSFEARLTSDRMPLMTCSYWILKLQAQFLSGHLVGALAAASRVKPMLDGSAGTVQLADYYYYTALTLSGLYEIATNDEQRAWREILREHDAQLREWAESNRATFGDKHGLVLAEIARIEKRDADATRLYEQAIQVARENGFVQTEALAQELAAQYYLSRGIDTAGYAYLRNARNCYDRWGAHGKVRQLDERYPRLREERAVASSTTMGASVGQLDLETVVRASQALSTEVVLPKLVERLMRIAVEHAGAGRGLLILIRDGERWVEAEATTGTGPVDVVARHSLVSPSYLPTSVLHYALRTREHVLLDDATADRIYGADEHVQRQRSRSVLCLPIVKQTNLVGALYLENNLTPGAFTPDRVTVLQLLASQAAISLENAALYTDLQLQVGVLQHLPVSAWTLEPDGTPDFVNQVWLEFAGQTREFVRSHPEAWMTAVHPEDREVAAKSFWDGVRSGRGFAIETRSRRAHDGAYRWHLQQAVALRDSEGKVVKFVGATTDIDDQKRTEGALRHAQGDLARINRVTTMGELAASLAHEIGQPLTGIVTNASVSERRLAGDNPELGELRLANSRLLRDARRATDIVDRIRAQFEKGAVKQETVDIGDVVRDTVALLRHEAARCDVSVRTELAAGLPPSIGDQVQLQQVVMNLIVNGIESMKVVEGPRDLVITARLAADDQILVSVSDTGAGFPPELAERIFDPFFTTKPHGTGMGLRISRSIIESHGGRLWAEATEGRGATLHIGLPAAKPATP